LYEDGANASRGAYKERLDKIYSWIGPITKRYEAHNAIIEEVPMFKNALNVHFNHLNSTVFFYVISGFKVQPYLP